MLDKASFRAKFSQSERKAYAKASPLAWILEYSPQILLPGKGYIDFEPYYAQQQVLKDRNRLRLLNKYRQGGFTTAFAAEAAHSFIHTPGAEIVVLSKSEKEAKKFHDKFYAILRSVDDPDKPRIDVENKLYTASSETGSSLQTLTSSPETGRSFSATDVYFDEMAHTRYADDIYQAAGPTVAVTKGRITCFSTPKGRSNLFARLCETPTDFGFSYHQFEWWFSPFFNPRYKQFMAAYLAKDKRAMAAEITAAKASDWYKSTLKQAGSILAFKQEYECSFDADEATVFSDAQLGRVFERNYLTHWNDDFGVAEDFWRKERQEGHRYVTFADLGRKRDATVIVTVDIDAEPRPEVAEYKRIPPGYSDWGLIISHLRQTQDYFKSEMQHDATGVGDPISEAIADISEPVIISNTVNSRVKFNMIVNNQKAMDEGAYRVPKIKQLYDEHKKYLWNDRNLVQDSVIALAGAVLMFYDPGETFVGVQKDFSYVEG